MDGDNSSATGEVSSFNSGDAEGLVVASWVSDPSLKYCRVVGMLDGNDSPPVFDRGKLVRGLTAKSSSLRNQS